MRIGEFDDAALRNLVQRQNVVTAELGRFGARLSEPPAGTPPATVLADAVRISPEARAAQFAIARPGSQPPWLPSPNDLAAALRAVLDAPDVPTRMQAAGRLSLVVRQLAAALPEGPAPPGFPVSAAAVRLASLLLTDGDATPLVAARVAHLVRRILAEAQSQPVQGSSIPALERASGEIAAAVLAARALPSPEQAPGSTLSVPAALLSLAAQAAPAARRRKRGAKETDHEGEPGRGDEDETDAGYRSSPRFT